MKDWTTIFYRNGYLFVLTVVLIFVAGFSALNNMPRLEDPVITNRNPLILTASPGTTAERVEALISEPIEVALQEIEEIKTVETTSRAGISLVAVELDDGVTSATNEQIFSRIRDQVDQAAASFPEGTLDPFFDDNRGAVAFTLIVGITWPGEGDPNLAVMKRVAEGLADELRNLAGTKVVRLYGDISEEITVTLKPYVAADLGVSLSDIAAALEDSDVKIPAGIVRGDNANLLIEVDGAFEQVERIADIPLDVSRDGASVHLGDIASIKKTFQQPVSAIGYTSGKRTILVGAIIEDTLRVDKWTQSALAAVADYEEHIGGTVTFERVFIQNEYTSDRLGSLAFNLFLGAVVVFVVILLMMGWRSAVIVGSALPLTAAMTIAIVGFSGGKLHQMSIFGMIIALGLLIDSAIVVSDEIIHHLRNGAKRMEAVSRAVRHLFVPLLSSTITTMLAFMPILLLPGNAGDFVGSIAESVIVALGSSFFVALGLIATLTGRFAERDPPTNWLARGVDWKPGGRLLRAMMNATLRFPVAALLLGLIIPGIGFFSATKLGVEFFPRVDRDMLGIKVFLPPESSIGQTEALSREIDALLGDYADVRKTHWMVGESFPSVYYNMIMNRDNSAFYAQCVVEVTDFKAVKQIIPKMQVRLEETFPQAQFIVEQFAQGPPAEAGVEIRVSGPDIQTLQDLGDQVRLVIAHHPQVVTTRETLSGGEPKVWVEADEAALRQTGMPLAAISRALQGQLVGFTGGSVLEGVESLPVRVRYTDGARGDVSQIASAPIPLNQPGAWIPLDAVAHLELRPSTSTITRRNGERVNTIRGWTENEALPIEVSQDVLNRIRAAGIEVPEGYTLDIGGSSENQSEAVGNLLLFVPVLVVLTVSTLILSFRSLRIAAILATVAFLSVGFGLLATFLYGLPFSFNTILGSFGLIGLAFNSSIVVIASIQSSEEAKACNPAALGEAALHCNRHLISTTLTTIGSFIPLLILVGGDFWPLLAIVLAGGVGGSTLLALFFTPAAYMVLFRGKLTNGDAPAGGETEVSRVEATDHQEKEDGQ